MPVRPKPLRPRTAATCRALTICSTLLLAAVRDPALGAEPSRPPVETRPLQVLEGTAEPARGYVSSKECQSCHPGEYDSWYGSFHRTMTQVVTASSVIADFDGVTLELDGGHYILEQRGDEFWVELPGPSRQRNLEAAQRSSSLGRLKATEPRIRRRIAMSTGFHHYQLYWYPSGNGRELYMLPFVFLKQDKRWAPRRSVFLQPPNLPEERLIWNVNCLPCHSTDGQPGYSADPSKARKGPDTRVAEVGIACEACHGPGQQHVASRRRKESAAPMVHPGRLAAPASAQVCGQCHSVNVPYTRRDWVDWLLDGPSFRPGETLASSRYVVRPSTVAKSPLIQEWIRQNPDTLKEWFWPDGMVRVAGREYNGLTESPCFQGGEFSCVSCHSQHQGEPDDLLVPAMRGDQACLRCHPWEPARIAKHTHHESESAGARCYNCHMPHTTYGLLKASRSHTIDSPSVQSDLEAGRPNACNLCHLDRTLSWTAGHLEEWYGQTRPPIPAGQDAVAHSVRGLLSGDAGLRALTAWHMGWEPAHEASGSGWIAPILAQALNDPYDVVRYIGARSLKRLPGFENFTCDFLAPTGERLEAVERATQTWEIQKNATLDRAGSRLLLDKDGRLERDALNRLLAKRDNRPVTLRE